jgi:DNA polymerase-3 subunit delta
MRIDSEQLPRQLDRGLAPIYTLVAGEPLLALEAGDRLRARARELGYGSRTLLVSEPGFDWAQLAHAGASLSLFADKRLIELRIPNGKPGVAGAAAIERYCSTPAPDTVTLVHLPAMEWRALQASWVQALERAGALVEARPIPRERLPQWLSGRLAQNGQSAAAETLRFIAERVEGNLLAAWQEVQKLALLLPPGKLDHEAVRKAVLDVARFDIDDVMTALLKGDRAHFVRVVDGLENEGAPLPLLVAILASELRSAHRAGAAVGRGQPVQNAVRENASGPRRGWMELAVQRWTLPQLQEALLDCARIDRIVKGLEPGASPWIALRQLGIGLTAARSAPRPRQRQGSAV